MNPTTECHRCAKFVREPDGFRCMDRCFVSRKKHGSLAQAFSAMAKIDELLKVVLGHLSEVETRAQAKARRKP